MAKRREKNKGVEREVQAIKLRVQSVQAGITTASPPVRMILLNLQGGELRRIGLMQDDAVRLLEGVASALAVHQNYIGQRVLDAMCFEDSERKLPFVAPNADRSTPVTITTVKCKRRESDKLIAGQAMMIAITDKVWDDGPTKTLQNMFEIEPDLTRHIDTVLTWIFQQLRTAGTAAKLVEEVRNDVILLIAAVFGALRKAHFDLWRDTVLGTRLTQIDPSLGKHRKSPPPDEATGVE